ncbi:mannose-1-phosphate guanylyltransferase [Sphingosinicella rhizophila]|uniref:Sugar phosphate nucleotidyltransferase n=1 Tax=Sphingosinicella rhizophila TaxID=3050082 RepID=A0ABU3Q8C8_9SPHN|nr:sugar phosphate nucleotidyltransferase [Sphingosinicella sp. GR2756]MDT9599654.1 sugar phosphate nucleotidyltransferase [Sphingosinicella sp. GR2756]
MSGAESGMRITPVILSGGSGSRLWPLSSAARPKQFLALSGGMTMLQRTALRTGDGARFADPILVGGAAHAEAIISQLAAVGIATPRLILEPVARNTAPAIALAALAAGEDAVLLVMPSDHLIGDEAAFLKGVEAALPFTREGWIVTFGIVPSHGETGYGYVARGAEIGRGIFRADRFVEKPNGETAQRFYDEGGWLWNGGIFLFRASDLLAALATHAPAVLEAAAAAMAAARRDEDGPILPQAEAFQRSPSISIDHAVMEKADRVATVPVEMDWSDIGSWDALHNIGPRDEAGNVATGHVLAIDSRDCLLRSDGPRVVAVGVHDLIVIATKENILVLPRGEGQRVKDVVEMLRLRDED